MDGAVHIDERADEAQNGSLLKVFEGQGGGHPARLATHFGEIVGMKTVPIHFGGNGDTNTLNIPDIAGLEIAQYNGQADGPITVAGHLLCIAPGFPGTLAKSNRLTYADHGMSWALSEKNGLFSAFAYQSEQ